MLLSEHQLDQLHGNDGEKDARTGRRREDRGKVKADDELGLHCLYKLRLRRKTRRYSRHQVKMIGQVQGDLEQRIWTCPKKELTQDPASSSQAWQKDAVLDESTRRLVAREEDQEHLKFTEDPKSTRRLIASGTSDRHQRQRQPHNLQISTDCVPHMEKVLSIVRQRYGLRDNMENLVANAATWCIFMSVTLQVAVHSGTDFSENLRSTRNQSKKSLRQLFQVTRKLITDQTEITCITTIDWQQLMWRETTLLSDKAAQFATKKPFVFSDPVLCVGGHQSRTRKRKGK